MRIQTLTGIVLLFSCGCQELQVAEHTVAIGAQSSYVQEQQVLDNLAMLAAEPSALPHYATMIQGADQVARTAQLTYTPNLDLLTAPGYFFGRYILDKQSAAISGTKQNQESIQVAPTSDPDKLLLIQAALHRALGICDSRQVALDAALTPAVVKPPPPTTVRITPQPLEVRIVDGKKADEKADSNAAPAPLPPAPSLTAADVGRPSNWQQYDAMITTGWFQICKKKDVPKHACNVGHYCDTYVYVLPGHEADLAKLTLVVLHLVSLDLSKLVVPEATTGERKDLNSVPQVPLAPPRIQTLPFFPTLPSPSPT